MSEGAEQSQAAAEQELARLVMPSIVELQKVLVDRIRGSGGKLRPPGELEAISLTSCDHHSCN